MSGLGFSISRRAASLVFRKCDSAGIIEHGSFRGSNSSAGFFLAGSVFLKHPHKNRLLQTWCNSNAQVAVRLSFLKDVLQKSLVFKFFKLKAIEVEIKTI